MFRTCEETDYQEFLNHPLYFQYVLYMRTVDEAKEYLDKFKHLCINPPKLQQRLFNSMYDYVTHYTDNYKSRSLLENFCGFFNIEFKVFNIPFEQLPPENLCIFHLSYNFNKLDNYKYTDNYRLNNILISKEDYVKFKPMFEEYKMVKHSSPYKHINHSSKYWFVVLSYDEDYDPKKCTYTISSKSYTNDDIRVLCGGGFIEKFTPAQDNLIRVYEKYDILNPVNVDKDVDKIINDVKVNAKRLYNPMYAKCVNNWIDYTKQLSEIYTNIDIKFFKALVYSIKYNLNDINIKHSWSLEYYMDFFKYWMES